MRSQQRWFGVLALLATAFLLLACGGGDSSETDDANEAARTATAAGEQQGAPLDDTDVPSEAAPIDSATSPRIAEIEAALEADPEIDAITPRLSRIVVNEDPDSPIVATLQFGADDVISHVDYYGPKLDEGGAPEYALIHVAGSDAALRMELGEGGAPESVAIPGFGDLGFDYAPTQLTITFVGVDGTEETLSLDLEPRAAAALGSGGSLLLLPGEGGQRLTGGPNRRPPPDLGVSLTRGTRLEVFLEGLEELPPGIAPFARVTDCVRGADLHCTFWVRQNGNFWSMGIIHTARAIGGEDEIPPLDWPSAESCAQARSALAENLGGYVAGTLSPALVPAALAKIKVWLGLLQASSAPAAVAAATELAPALVTAAVGTLAYMGGTWVGEKLFGDPDCEGAIQRTRVAASLIARSEPQEFSVEVCFPNLVGVAYDARCQRVGPYRPFAGDVELGSLTFRAQEEAEPLEVTAISVTDGRAGEPVGAAVGVRGGEPPYNYAWSAPNAANPSGDFVEADGGAGFTFPEGGVHPVQVTITDAGGQEVTADASARIQRLVNIAGAGSAGASSVYAPPFNAGRAIDGNTASSWFSSGPDGGTTTFVWTAPEETRIASFRIVGNGGHSTLNFRTGFGFGVVTAQVLNAAGEVVWQDEAGLPGTPDPTVTFAPDLEGSQIILIFGGHENNLCGGFAELSVLAWEDPE